MPEYSDEEFLDAFDQDEPPASDVSSLGDEHIETLGPHESTTRTIAKRVGCTTATANRRLAELADPDEVEFLSPLRVQVMDETSKDLIVRRIPEDGGRIYDPDEWLLE